MKRGYQFTFVYTLFLLCSIWVNAQVNDYRPGLFFREDWKEIPPETPVNQNHVNNLDLSSVEEVGFSDLMPGGISAACSRLDWIEVYGYIAGDD